MAFEAINDLERSLVKAATDPAHRPQFYRDFLSAEVFVAEHGPLRGHATRRTLQAGEHLALRTLGRDGKTVIPVFSSLARLQASSVLMIGSDEGPLLSSHEVRHL